jgi:hypothetical protein
MTSRVFWLASLTTANDAEPCNILGAGGLKDEEVEHQAVVARLQTHIHPRRGTAAFVKTWAVMRQLEI